MANAHRGGARLLILPELCVTGATCGDLHWQHKLLEEAERALFEIVRASTEVPGLTVAVGAPLRFEGALYSCAVFLRDGELLGCAPLPSGDPRNFASPERIQGQIGLGGQGKFAFAHNLIVRCGDFAVSTEPGADILACLSAFPADAESDTRLPAMAAHASARTGGAFLLACPGPGESSAAFVYTGLCAIAENGCLLASGEGDDVLVFAKLTPGRREKSAPPPLPKAALPRSPFLPDDERRERLCDRVPALQALGLRRRMEHLRAEYAVVDASGGADAALALLVCAQALDDLGLPRGNLIAVPPIGERPRSHSGLERLAECLGASIRNVPAAGESRVREHDAVFGMAAGHLYEQILIDLSEETAGVGVPFTNLTELALGMAFSGGCGNLYAVNAGVPATCVRAVLARYAQTCGDGRTSEILRDLPDTCALPAVHEGAGAAAIQHREVPAELCALYEFYLFHFMQEGPPFEELLRMAGEAFRGAYESERLSACLADFLRRFFTRQAGRSHMPDGPAVFGLSLSTRVGFRMPPDIDPAPWLRGLS
jgi:NAD+ synthase (glutamine-hydrolysing)